jgi:hypothetical protein
MLSHGLIGALQEGHLEDGRMIDNPLGILYMQTFRKEPMMRPKLKISTYGIREYILS